MVRNPPRSPNLTPYLDVPKPKKRPWDVAMEEGTPNSILDLQQRLRNARDFLQEHPNEKHNKACAINHVHPSTLTSFLKRPCNRQHGGQNRILKVVEESALTAFICHLVGNYL